MLFDSLKAEKVQAMRQLPTTEGRGLVEALTDQEAFIKNAEVIEENLKEHTYEYFTRSQQL